MVPICGTATMPSGNKDRSSSSGCLRRIFLTLAVLPFVLLAAQAGYFVWALSNVQDPQKADVIVSFEGAYDRARAAYGLVDQSYASNLLISPSTERQLAFYEKRFKPTRPYQHILEEKARTTFENALFTEAAIKKNNLKSVILVTSWDHMPRAYLLLRAMTLGSGVRVAPHRVATGSLSQDNWYRHRKGWKMIYNEIIEFWGSLAELANYKIKGRVSDQVPGQSGLVGRLKQMLLFKLDHKEP